LQEESGVPTCAFAAGFDAAFGLVGAHEAEREAADDGHVLGTVAVASRSTFCKNLTEGVLNRLWRDAETVETRHPRRGDSIDLH
jgi:hypothetical protein